MSDIFLIVLPSFRSQCRQSRSLSSIRFFLAFEAVLLVLGNFQTPHVHVPAIFSLVSFFPPLGLVSIRSNSSPYQCTSPASDQSSISQPYHPSSTNIFSVKKDYHRPPEAMEMDEACGRRIRGELLLLVWMTGGRWRDVMEFGSWSCRIPRQLAAAFSRNTEILPDG
jgi:hypothetical protein